MRERERQTESTRQTLTDRKKGRRFLAKEIPKRERNKQLQIDTKPRV